MAKQDVKRSKKNSLVNSNTDLANYSLMEGCLLHAKAKGKVVFYSNTTITSKNSSKLSPMSCICELYIIVSSRISEFTCLILFVENF